MNEAMKMGGLSSILGMLPGMGMNAGQMQQLTDAIDDKKLKHTEAIIQSMTPEEREDPKLMNISRKRRLAAGTGLDISEVNRFIKQFEESRKMMKKIPGMMGGKKGRFKFPF